MSKLKLECIAIGSMPHDNLTDAMAIVSENFGNIPFWPQMVKISKKEDMSIQFLEGMPSFFYGKSFLDTEYDTFYDDLENFFLDYETVLSGEDTTGEILSKYQISDENSVSFKAFLELLKDDSVKYAKGQITGPFTLATTLVDKNGRCAIYDDTLKEIILKLLSLKALWQINQIKKVNSSITPIIFIDEPTISQLGTSAYVTISENDVVYMIKEVSEIIQNAGGISAIHCCGKCDWKVPIKCNVNMLNLDAYSYAQNLSVYRNDVRQFLLNGGKIVWGVVPTLDKQALAEATVEIIEERFTKAIEYLTKKGIDEKLIIENSLISTSCGAGSLTKELANKAFRLTKEISTKLKARYNDI